MGKDESGASRPLQVSQKLKPTGIGFGTEGAFEPWWTDLYNNTSIAVNIKRRKKKDSSKRERGQTKKQAQVKEKKRKSSRQASNPSHD